jgi:hypothetical protein
MKPTLGTLQLAFAMVAAHAPADSLGTGSAVPPLAVSRAAELPDSTVQRSSFAARFPPWFTPAPALPPPPGPVLRVSTAAELLAAVDRVEPGGTILLADGHYPLTRTMVLRDKRGVTLRGASGDPSRVILSGQGWDSHDRNDDLLHIARSDEVTIADLTFADARSYGIKVEAESAPRNIHIYHCHFRDLGVRAIKGSAGQDPAVRAVGGSVRFCYFENTRVPPADWLFGGDYIAAIDMMALENWTFSDNVFRNIRGRNGGARAAVFIWVRSRQIVVERNVFSDCDRGIAFGNPGQSTADVAGEPLAYVTDSVIRNNFIAGGPDCGIELWHSRGILVHHNTIWRPDRNWTRGIRIGAGTARTEIANNLVHGEIRNEGGEARLRHNLAGRLDGYFLDPSVGDLRLTPEANGAIDQGMPLPGIMDDLRRHPRDERPDLGAWEAPPPRSHPPAGHGRLRPIGGGILIEKAAIQSHSQLPCRASSAVRCMWCGTTSTQIRSFPRSILTWCQRSRKSTRNSEATL